MGFANQRKSPIPITVILLLHQAYLPDKFAPLSNPLKLDDSMKKLFLSLSVVALLTATSCNKDSDDVPQQITPTKENLVGTYKISSIIMQTGSSPGVDVFSSFDACEKDDLYKLNANMTYEVEDAGTECTPPNDYSDVWDLINSTTIVIEGMEATIKTWDGQTLVVSGTDQGSTLTFTYVKQ